MAESSESDVDDGSVIITKKSLKKAIALLEDDESSKEAHFGGRKAVRECQLPCLQAHNLCAAADIFSGDGSFNRQVLEELRVSFLTNNYPAAAKLLEWLLHRATKPDLPILWRSAVVLFLNEDCSNQKLLDEFLEMCADQRLPESKIHLIKLLVSLPGPEMMAARTKKLSRKVGSEVTDSRSVTENEDPDDPDCFFS
ncbi:uncharacterized protein LOC128990699 [Macrosteles quadrilineatus]|uniref:uncharacterized protein LOC128982530 n=1 Tax=Macrosteles quadrilineatus TaxID=74068 RepID=UPI0023E1481C|nr:uncharacterized protein LOC128982530 [Macrosteles quadrilineatus]XP_054269194.1 uncharacterized protein LOC128990699 [Macrosteles quadrilineatus]XP_054269196.1 uncharacterized protein LOC128990699 [Macrosteles quadrilineatus]